MVTIYYYIYNNVYFGSLNAYKIRKMSERDSDGVVHEMEVRCSEEFEDGLRNILLDEEWLG